VQSTHHRAPPSVALAPSEEFSMSSNVARSLRHALTVITAVVLVAACAPDMPAGPSGARASLAPSLAESREVDLGSCSRLAAPAGSELAFRTFAEGVQIYRWNGSAWGFVAPVATLSADAAGQGIVGTHYAGPTWETFGGSRITGAVLDRCTYDPSAIQWLQLTVATNNEQGVLRGVTHILRVQTVAGTAPAEPGTVVGEEARVPYRAVYLFYRAP
jgi:hypothetical protein